MEIVTAQYGSLGHSSGGRPADVAPDLFTFVSRQGIGPTNNAAKREPYRTARGTYGRDCTPQAEGDVGIIMTCIGT